MSSPESIASTAQPQPFTIEVSSEVLASNFKHLGMVAQELRTENYGRYALDANFVQDVAGYIHKELIRRGHTHLLEMPGQSEISGGKAIFSADEQYTL